MNSGCPPKLLMHLLAFSPCANSGSRRSSSEVETRPRSISIPHAFAGMWLTRSPRGVTVVEKGAWSKPDRLWLRSKSTANPGSSTVYTEPDDEGYYVDLTTIDSVVEDLRVERVDFLKMEMPWPAADIPRQGLSSGRELHL